MKLLRLKITDPDGFRSLPCGFEHYFRTEWALQDELAQPEGFAPFVCAGPNGSGKSNLLEVLAAIFYQLEWQRVRLSLPPESSTYDGADAAPCAFELEYRIKLSRGTLPATVDYAHVRVTKAPHDSPQMYWLNRSDFPAPKNRLSVESPCSEGERDFLLPNYVLGYSSGENEILSLPFFKMRFALFDEYWLYLKEQLPYSSHPETRLAYLDSSLSQAILLCNLLLQDDKVLTPFREEIGLQALLRFRIILQRSIQIDHISLFEFDTASIDQGIGREIRLRNERPELSSYERLNFVRQEIVRQNPALSAEIDDAGNIHYRLNLMQLLEGDERSSLAVSALKRCATLSYLDEVSDTLILDYWVNSETKHAFQVNFASDPLMLFQAFQILLTLNLYSVNNSLKSEIYQSNSPYVREIVPTLAWDDRTMHFEDVYFSKNGVDNPIELKELSDGEHQMLHSLGLCLLFRNTNTLFLLDEPETHFNPDWRANFISRLRQCLPSSGDVGQEMLITTYSPFLISDSKPEKVLVFDKDKVAGKVSISHPDYNTLGASINKITMNTFGKRETIGGHAQQLLEGLRERFERGEENTESLITEIHQQLGDSVEKLLLVKAILDGDQQEDGGIRR